MRSSWRWVFEKAFPEKKEEKDSNKTHWASIAFNVKLFYNGENLQHERKGFICIRKAIYMCLVHE